MLNEGKGISDVVKENVDEIWNLFLNNSYSTHIYKFGNERLKYKDNLFDYVISVNFIHHAKNPVKCLKEMIRVVKNKLIVADLNKTARWACNPATNGCRHQTGFPARFPG